MNRHRSVLALAVVVAAASSCFGSFSLSWLAMHWQAAATCGTQAFHMYIFIAERVQLQRYNCNLSNCPNFSSKNHLLDTRWAEQLFEANAVRSNFTTCHYLQVWWFYKFAYFYKCQKIFSHRPQTRSTSTLALKDLSENLLLCCSKKSSVIV